MLTAGGPGHCVLGIDQGTTTTTAVVVDEGGQVVASRSVPVAARFPRPGWVEQDPWEILAAVKAAALPLIEAFPIEAVGLDNQGETFLLWDRRDGQPLTPAIVWQDQRAAAWCDGQRSKIDPDWLRRKTGLRLDSYFSAPKLRYVLDHDPALQTAAQAGWLRFGTTDTWVLWHLSHGRLHLTDASTASRTLLFNIQSLAWDDELLALFDVPRSLLPEVVPAAGLAGELDFGTGRPLPLHALLVDQQAALFGQACFQPGDMKCTFGTGSFLLMNVGPKPALSQGALLTTVAWQLPGETAYALDGGIFVTGAAVQWLADSLHLLPDVMSSAQLAAESTDTEVVCIPALAGLAAPYWQADVRGALFGLSRATTPADIVRATLDGIACRVAEVVQAMQRDGGWGEGAAPASLKVDGGPTQNGYLMQRVADLTGLEVQVAAAREATAIGIANLAAHSAWGVSLPELAARWRAEA
ncbi:MAG: FGGY family carbohydrate kinase, partial [Anaerolineales bacterium]